MPKTLIKKEERGEGCRSQLKCGKCKAALALLRLPRTMVQLVCFGPCFLQGSQLFLVMPPQQSKISGKHVFLYSPGLKEHIPGFIIIFPPKLQELRGVEVTPPLSTGAKTYQLYHRRELRSDRDFCLEFSTPLCFPLPFYWSRSIEHLLTSDCQ